MVLFIWFIDTAEEMAELYDDPFADEDAHKSQGYVQVEDPDAGQAQDLNNDVRCSF
jgi:hypothetical protein